MFPEIDRFQKWLRCRNPHTSTHVHYTSDVKLLFAWAGKPLASITLHDVDAYVAHCRSLGHAPATVNRDESNTYDSVGNRLKKGVSGAVTEYVYADANRLTSAGGVEYTWDQNGNLLDDGERTYEYDYANRLAQVVTGTFTTTFTYNGNGHQVAKSENGVTTSYVVAVLGLSQVLVETTGGQSTWYAYGHDLLVEGDDETRMFRLNDGLGGVILESVIRDPFDAKFLEAAVAGQAEWTARFTTVSAAGSQAPPAACASFAASFSALALAFALAVSSARTSFHTRLREDLKRRSALGFSKAGMGQKWMRSFRLRAVSALDRPAWYALRTLLRTMRRNSDIFSVASLPLSSPCPGTRTSKRSLRT